MEATSKALVIISSIHEERNIPCYINFSFHERRIKMHSRVVFQLFDVAVEPNTVVS